MNDLCAVDKEYLDSLKGINKYRLKKAYDDWRERQRKTDKLNAKRTNPNIIKYHKKYVKENKEKIKEHNRMYYLKKKGRW